MFICDTATQLMTTPLKRPMLREWYERLSGKHYFTPFAELLQGNIKIRYRLRVGDFRMLFSIKENVMIVVKISTRGDAYKE